MTDLDLSELDGIDPHDLNDHEAARLHFHFSTLEGDAWDARSSCEGWSVRDVLAHLAASEEYNRACLDGAVGALFEKGAELGITTLDAFNEYGVRSFDDTETAELLAIWQERNAYTRREMRERDGGMMETSVGEYPVHLQAFHLGAELAIHADDIGIPVSESESSDRLDWQARFARVALRESKPDAQVEAASGRTRVALGSVDVELDDDVFVHAVDARLGGDHGLSADERAALSIMP